MVKIEDKRLGWLLLISFAIRALLAGIVELGDDEVYYRLYAMYPDWSHFDHPPMVGWVIQLFSLNLLFDTTFFIRFGSVVIGTVNTWLIYRIGLQIRNKQTAWIAALLYTASVYCSVIVGVFIIPDTPLALLWLMTISLMLKILPKGGEDDPLTPKRFLLAGALIGLGMLAKYTALFLWVGAFLYCLLRNRRMFMRLSPYMAALLTLIMFSPVLIWNMQNDFISFTFHEARVVITDSSLFRPDYFAKELLGGFMYNNPINWVLFVTTIVILFRKKVWKSDDEVSKILLLFSLPIIVVFLFFSLFRDTLPHWGAPGFFGLMLLAALNLEDKQKEGTPGVVKWSVGFLSVGLLVAVVAIHTGCLPMQKPDDKKDMGAWDFTLSLYGMEQAGEKFGELHRKCVADGIMAEDAPIVCDRWFPAAHYDLYIATPNAMRLITIGKLEDTHKYEWITQERGGIKIGEDAYTIISSRFHRDVNKLYGDFFEEISLIDTLYVERMGEPVYMLTVYKLKHLKKRPELQIPNHNK